jgi:cell division septation protein DedD
MSTAQQDTEITLGTGRMLAIFFAFVLVCAVFFAIGFSLGRRTTTAVAGISQNGTGATPAAIVRPSAAKNDATQNTPQSQSQSSDFSFYKAVGEKNANTALPAQGSTAQTANPSASAITAEAPASAATTAPTPSSLPVGAYYVQVAAVTRQEDANALVEALRKKQYPAFTADTTSNDRFYRVQIGPYAELKDAEAMRVRLVGDGYNPIVKK